MCVFIVRVTSSGIAVPSGRMREESGWGLGCSLVCGGKMGTWFRKSVNDMVEIGAMVKTLRGVGFGMACVVEVGSGKDNLQAENESSQEQVECIVTRVRKETCSSGTGV